MLASDNNKADLSRLSLPTANLLCSNSGLEILASLGLFIRLRCRRTPPSQASSIPSLTLTFYSHMTLF